MKRMLTQQEYYDGLPKKPLGANVIFFNDKNEFLLVKPNYKPYWLLVGGTIDPLESPRAAAIREVKEEIGLDIDELQLLIVDYSIAPEGDGVKFMFYGGILSDQQINAIVLQKEELDEFTFVPIETAKTMVNELMSLRIPHCMDALKNNDAIYLENGMKVL